MAEFDHVVHLIAPGNTRSIAVAERIGSRFERIARFHGTPVRVTPSATQCNGVDFKLIGVNRHIV